MRDPEAMRDWADVSTTVMCPTCGHVIAVDGGSHQSEAPPAWPVAWPEPVQTPQALLESSRIVWARDWDALVFGAIVGAIFQALLERLI